MTRFDIWAIIVVVIALLIAFVSAEDKAEFVRELKADWAYLAIVAVVAVIVVMFCDALLEWQRHTDAVLQATPIDWRS